MTELLDVGTPGVIGVRVSGRIEKSDIDQIIAAAKPKFDEAEKICAYVEMEDFDGIFFEALLEDLKFALPNLGRLKKKAVASDTKRMETTVAMGDQVFPNAEIKHFPFDRVAEAKNWISW